MVESKDKSTLRLLKWAFQKWHDPDFVTPSLSGQEIGFRLVVLSLRRSGDDAIQPAARVAGAMEFVCRHGRSFRVLSPQKQEDCLSFCVFNSPPPPKKKKGKQKKKKRLRQAHVRGAPSPTWAPLFGTAATG